VGEETRAGRQFVVALYGRSLMLAGVEQRLARQPHLRVVAIDGPTAGQALGPLAPDVLIVDLGTVPMESALALLGDRPDLLLVGLEASGARLLVLSGEQAGSFGTDDLMALVERRTAVGRATAR
jgi:hypothetical protein